MVNPFHHLIGSEACFTNRDKKLLHLGTGQPGRFLLQLSAQQPGHVIVGRVKRGDDQVLIAVAKAMQAATRDVDTVCRWGGEEFLIVLPDTDAAEALRVAERVRQAVQQAHLPQAADQALSVTITLGVSSLQLDEAERWLDGE